MFIFRTGRPSLKATARKARLTKISAPCRRIGKSLQRNHPNILENLAFQQRNVTLLFGGETALGYL